LAELKAVGRRIDESKELSHPLDGRKRTKRPLQVLNRRIVGMGAELHAVLLRHMAKVFKKILEPSPMLLRRSRR
jgi:uncharacterized protein (DUF2342 family)